MPSAMVVDLSHHNEVTDFTALHRSGVLGVIHKASEATDYADPTYNARRIAAKAAGLLWGGYHFLRPGDMKAQAAWFIACATAKPDDLLCADYEDDALALDDLQAFLAAVESLTGRKAVIYSGHLIKEQVGNRVMPGLGQHHLWIAQYTAAPAPDWPRGTWPQWWLWQFDDGENGPPPHGAPGVTGAVDLNAYDGTAVDLAASWAGSEEEPEAPPPTLPVPGPYVVTLTIDAPPGVTINVVRT